MIVYVIQMLVIALQVAWMVAPYLALLVAVKLIVRAIKARRARREEIPQAYVIVRREGNR